jgi:hypothetical protein
MIKQLVLSSMVKFSANFKHANNMNLFTFQIAGLPNCLSAGMLMPRIQYSVLNTFLFSIKHLFYCFQRIVRARVPYYTTSRVVRCLFDNYKDYGELDG